MPRPGPDRKRTAAPRTRRRRGIALPPRRVVRIEPRKGFPWLGLAAGLLCWAALLGLWAALFGLWSAL